MVDNYIIETHFGAAGLVVRSGRDFMFFSAKKEFNALEWSADANSTHRDVQGTPALVIRRIGVGLLIEQVSHQLIIMIFNGGEEPFCQGCHQRPAIE